MLILTRKSQQAVVVGGTDKVEQLLKVTVLEVRGSVVKLGFEAGDEVPIFRHEVWERICAEDRDSDAGAIAPSTNRLVGVHRLNAKKE